MSSTSQAIPADAQQSGPAVAQQMIELLSQQRALYERLTKLSQSQRSLITGDRTEQLLSVLAERQRLVEAIQQLAERMRPLQSAWPKLCGDVEAGQVEHVDRLLADIRRLLGGLLEQDQNDADLLAARKQTTAAAVAECRKGRRVDAAYAAQAYQPTASREWTES
jgi:hypothetical protein